MLGIFFIIGFFLAVTSEVWPKSYQKIIVISIGILIILIVAFINDYQNDTYKPRKLYECPCETKDLVIDQIYHYSKSGDTTVTTIISLDNCIKK